MTPAMEKMTTDQAILLLRSDPKYAEVVHDSYLEEDLLACAERFLASAEFAEVRAHLEGRLEGGTVLDLGAGTGVAAYGLARCGAKIVYALEPDASEVIGRGAIRALSIGLPIEILDATGEAIPLPDNSVDAVYARQVLHHTRDLPKVMRECARVLKSGGLLCACREHVVDDQEQLQAFLQNHPVHQLAGGEHAFMLDVYTSAIKSAGLRVERVYGPWDTVVNAFPSVKTREELDRLPRRVLEERFGKVGTLISFLPGIRPFIWTRIRRQRVPGRMYSFLATKP